MKWGGGEGRRFFFKKQGKRVKFFRKGEKLGIGDRMLSMKYDSDFRSSNYLNDI